MRNLFCAFLILIAVQSRAALTVTNVINYGAVTTNNGNSFTLTSVTIPAVTYSIQNGGLGNTNDVIFDDQFSMDGSTWTTLTNYYFPTTNSQTATFAPVMQPTIYRRMRARAATNSPSVGVQAIRVFQ